MENRFSQTPYYPEDVNFGQENTPPTTNNFFNTNLLAGLLKDNPMASLLSGGNLNQNQLVQMLTQLLGNKKSSPSSKSDEILFKNDDDNFEEF